MKWLLVFGLIVIILNARATLTGHSDKISTSDSSDSSKSLGPGPKSGHGLKPGLVRHKKSSRITQAVKIVRVKVLKLDEEYFSSKGSLQVIQVNQTYNRLKVDLTINKNLPSNTKVAVKIYGSKTIFGDYEIIKENVSCGATDKTSKYFKYLPRGLIKYININGGLVKGHIASENFGYFKFYRMLSVVQLKYAYYKVVFNYECDGQVILSHDYRFQSVEIVKAVVNY